MRLLTCATLMMAILIYALGLGLIDHGRNTYEINQRWGQK